MGITLSGTKPKDTYQSLLKTADNVILDSILRVISDGSGNNSSLSLSINRVGLSSDSSVTTQSVAVIESTSTNAGIVLKPNGTGAIMATVPDGTATGGSARGNYAVDLQMARHQSSKVASGLCSVIGGGERNQSNNSHATVVGGYTNTASGQESFVGGGSDNTASGLGSFIGGGDLNLASSNYAIVVGGINNQATQFRATVGGGQTNIASSQYSTISGGQSNTASTNTHATVVGGYSNTASGGYSIAGGWANTASGLYSIAIGRGNIASGQGAVAIGGGNASFEATASGIESFAMGQNALANNTQSFAFGSKQKAYLHHGFVHGFTRFAQGEGQYQDTTVQNEGVLSSAGTFSLLQDSAYAWQGSGLIPDGNNRLWAAKITATAFVSAVSGTTLVLGDSYMAEYTVLFKRVGGTSSVVGTNAGNIISDTNMISSAFTFSAGASQELAITFKAPTTANADTFRCVAKVELVEVAY